MIFSFDIFDVFFIALTRCPIFLIEAVNKMEAQQQANNTPQCAKTENTGRENATATSDAEIDKEEEEDEVLLKTEDEWSEDEQLTPSPTIHQGTPPSHDIHCEEEELPAENMLLCCPMRQQDGLEEAGPQEENTSLCEEEDCGTCSPQELLQEAIERLKTRMETDGWRRGRGQTGGSFHMNLC